MDPHSPYFFCGIGGSGMLPLALILRAKGFEVAGSDRALDQGRIAAKFEYLRNEGISLFPQDGSGFTRADQVLVTSAAVEDSVPDVQAARRLGAKTMRRAELLSGLFNGAGRSIGVAGTSGKSTTTAMIGWVFTALGQDPTIMNGAVMKNFVTEDSPFASARVGKSSLFVSEVDESDGSIAHYRSYLAVVNNIALDHKSLEELRTLFRDFIARSQIAVLNLDNDETAHLARTCPDHRTLTFSLTDASADLSASDIKPGEYSISCTVTERQTHSRVSLQLQVPGRHNVANALAALCVARALQLPLADAAKALSTYVGIKRRFELVGQSRGVTVLDDFAHNPDKISATLSTLHDFPGRLIVLFQPHGFRPLTLMKDGFIEAFRRNLKPGDILIMPEPIYFGGTTVRDVTSKDLVAGVRGSGNRAESFDDRARCAERICELAQKGDRIIIMGARDDTLSQFAADLLAAISAKPVS